MSRVISAGFAVVILLVALGACGEQDRVPANVYQSRAAGFRLVMPDSWMDHYRVVEVSGRTASVHQPKALHLVEFLYMPQDTARGAQNLLNIVVFDAPDWIAVSSERRPPGAEVIAQREGRVWVAVLPSPDAFEAAGADSVRYAQMYMDLEAVKRAFSLL